jgi:phosphodiesterase/alkaline phosphatase D-like protein
VTKGGEKIGIVGATTYDLLSKTSPNGTVPKDDGIPTTDDLQEVAAYIQTAVDALKTAGVNKIVLVDQLDTIERNKALAPLVSGIDVMVAGGGHERLGDANDKAVGFNGHSADFAGTFPIVTAGKDGKATLIVTTDTEYSYLGRLVVDFNANGEIIVPNLNPNINGAYASTEANLQAAYSSTGTAKQIVASSAIGTQVSAITDAINNVIVSKDSNIYGYTKVYLEGDRAFGRAQEVNLGDISADANLFKAKAAIAPGTILASLKNGGGIRASVGSIGPNGEKLPPSASGVKPAGAISQLDAENALRFDNKLIVFDTTPQGLLNILNYAAGLAPGNGGYAQIGGVRFSYDPTKAAGQKVQDIAIYDLDDKLVARVADNGVLLTDAPAKISVVTLNFTANGGDGYPIKENADNFRYLLNNGTLSAPVDEALDLTAAANVPANTLGELKAFEDFLKANYGTPQKAYNVADTPATQDQRIQNLQVKAVDTVIPPNTAPTGLTLSNTIATIAENTLTTARIKVADIGFTDDIQGVNNLTVTGADASAFEVFNKALYIKAGTTLDFEAKKSYSVAINLDDPTVGATPDATQAFTLSLSDVTLGAFSAVAAGDATSKDALLWTRTFDPATKKGLNSNLTAQVSTDANFSSIAFSYKVPTRIDGLDHDGTAKVEATGLASGTKYYYRFLDAGGEFSQVGTFKTAPGADVKAPVRFAFSGDYDGVMRPYSSTANFGKLNLDFYGNVGDTIYETASTGSPAAADAAKDPAQALIDYHRKYLENLQPVVAGGFPSLQTLFASQSNYTSLDNHELGNKQLINGGAPSILAPEAGNGTNNTAYDVNKTGTFINQTAGFKALEQAYSDYQPIKEKLVVAPDDARSNGTQQLYNSQQWGANALYINTDTRSYRDVRLKTTDAAGKITTTDDTGARADNPDRTLLGKTQLAWLKQNLLDAQKNGTAWKFVAITDPIDQLGAIGSGADGGKSWIGGYRAERNDLLKFIADNGIKNVVFLSCDDHQNRINELTYLDNINDPTSLRVLPNALSIVDGPIGATGPDQVTDHSFSNIKSLADKLAAKQVTEKVNPIGLDPNFAGLKNVYREGDPNADINRQAVDFYSPDTFNYTTFDISADGKTLNVAVQGINSYASNTFQEPTAANPIRTILSFSLDANVPPTLVIGSTNADNLIAGVTPGFSPSNNVVFTGAGKDTVDIAIAGNLASNNRVDLGSGDDVIYVANADRIFGSTGDDVLDATDAKDYRASGGAGNDTFFLGINGRALGGDGNDKFFASTGGGNLLSGGAGVDQFWIANGDIPAAANTILDFQIGTDVVGIQGIGANATNIVLAQVGANTSIGFGGQTLAVLNGIQANSLTPSNPGQFIFA